MTAQVHDLTPTDAEFTRDLDQKIKCPHCRDGWLTTVTDSRPGTLQDIPSIRRRRVCNGCGQRSSTYEFVDTVITRLFRTQNAKQALAMRIVDMIDKEVRGELTKRLNLPYHDDDVN